MNIINYRILLVFIPCFYFSSYPINLSAQSSSQHASPQFSLPGGFYPESIQLEIETSEDTVILYTLDGSQPNPDYIGGTSYTLQTEQGAPLVQRTMTTHIYESPIQISDRSAEPNQVSAIPNHYSHFKEPNAPVDKGTVVRAAVYKDGHLSDITTATYFVGSHFQEYRELPVLSIAVQENGFWGYEDGIYVPGIHFNPNQEPVNYNNGNYFQRGEEWERPIHIEYFDTGGNPGFSQQAGIRIHGGTSRWFVNRSFRIYARSEYGQSTIEYPIFPHRGPQVHKRLKLRTSGQDYEHTYFRDALMSVLMLGGEATVEDYRPVNLFINGEYWGITNIRERFDHHYVERNFGVPREEVDILEEGTDAHYSEFLNYINTTPPSQDDYYEMVNQWINLDSYLDLKIAEIFFGRWDMHWEHWRVGSDPASRWKWVIWDFDVAMLLPGYPPTLRTDWTGAAGHDAGTNYLAPFLTDYRTDGLNRNFYLMMMNPDVRNRFLNRLALMMSSNLSEHRILAEIDRMQEGIEQTMPKHIERWSALERGIRSMDERHTSIELLRQFSTERHQHVYNHATALFGLSGISNMQIETSGGNGIVEIEGTDTRLLNREKGIENTGVWNGVLFNDIPVTLTATPDAGYRFDSWSGDISSEEHTITIDLSSAINITANFLEIDEEPGDEMNPTPHILSDGDFAFDYWSPDEPEGSFPNHVIFQQSSVNDPGLETEMTSPYYIPFEDENNNDYNEDDYDKFGFPYQLTRRTRINALGDRGISMINTGRSRDLGAVVLALDTRGAEQSVISWTAETIAANSRTYNIRLQCRVGFLDTWQDVLTSNGQIAEYERSEDSGEVHFENIPLPPDAYDEPYVQLRWKYYFTGTRLSEESGQRDELRIDNIRVEKADGVIPEPPGTGSFALKNFPNPFSHSTTIGFYLEDAADVTIDIYSIHGRHIRHKNLGTLTSGNHRYQFSGDGLSSGTYFYRFRAGDLHQTRKMMLIR